ncbi:hypothetical protein CY652_19685 [Burkholderia sp. WAC0059]|uniref:hypothetical protein n=1 Tax=Burkholderia sp. WAC0059 TaxID=2066022 RepID=UPI000C7F06D3|nr:hypothetical protein [Burkholderia sp. WAC0059]PLZ00687.1 hypothetical protein CY652_19685 [Burkholderia sp. WAC0059]
MAIENINVNAGSHTPHVTSEPPKTGSSSSDDSDEIQAMLAAMQAAESQESAEAAMQSASSASDPTASPFPQGFSGLDNISSIKPA